jgi:hypothetical protein
MLKKRMKRVDVEKKLEELCYTDNVFHAPGVDTILGGTVGFGFPLLKPN